MLKVVNYFARLSVIVGVLLVLRGSNTLASSTIENDNVNKTVNLSTMALKVIEIEEELKYRSIDTYTGDLTGYAYNCSACTGKLACLSSYNIKDGTNTYYDEEYGEVYIVASSKNLECGSIISFYSTRIGEGRILAIVLDRGVTGSSIDILTSSEDYALAYIGRSSITYDVLRNGWS